MTGDGLAVGDHGEKAVVIRGVLRERERGKEGYSSACVHAVQDCIVFCNEE